MSRRMIPNPVGGSLPSAIPSFHTITLPRNGTTLTSHASHHLQCAPRQLQPSTTNEMRFTVLEKVDRQSKMKSCGRSAPSVGSRPLYVALAEVSDQTGGLHRLRTHVQLSVSLKSWRWSSCRVSTLHGAKAPKTARVPHSYTVYWEGVTNRLRTNFPESSRFVVPSKCLQWFTVVIARNGLAFRAAALDSTSMLQSRLSTPV